MQSGAVGFDLNAACSGFLFAYNTAPGVHRSRNLPDDPGHWKRESFTALVYWTDRVEPGHLRSETEPVAVLPQGRRREESYRPGSHSWTDEGGPALDL